MDTTRASSARPPIWQNKCRNRTGSWFSRSTRSYPQNDLKTANFHHQNSVGKPPSLLRLSSTGDSVEDVTEIRNFEPSNLCGSESTGIFDRFTKFAFSAATNTSKTTSMNLTKDSLGKFGGQNQMDLSVLMETFDHSKVKMERPNVRQYDNVRVMPVTRPQQGNMNGFVKEGIYHTFQRQGTYRAMERQPMFQAFSFLNIEPFSQRHHHLRQPHPYTRWNQNMAKQRNSLLWSGTPQSHGHMSATISDSALFHDQFVDLGIQSRMQSTHAVGVWNHADRIQKMKGQRRGHRNKMMKNQAEMTQQQNPNKSTGCVYTQPNTGSPHQANRTPPYGQKTIQTQLKSVKNQECCFKNQKLKTGDKTTESSKHSDKKCSENVKTLMLKENCPNPQDDNGRPKIKVNCPNDSQQIQPMQLKMNIASAVVDQCWEQLNPVGAEPGLQHSAGTKSSDNKNSAKKEATFSDEKSQLCNSQFSELSHVNREEVRDEAFPPRPYKTNDQPSEKKLSSNTDLEPTPSPKPLHSSLAYLLAQTVNNDSDFSDSDWDAEETPPSSDSWNFLKCVDDPYNPLYGWKCNSYSDKQQEAIKLDSSFGDDELDSGISSLQNQHDETEDLSDKNSESDDEEWSDEELIQISSSFISSDEPYNPSNGWKCAPIQSFSKNGVTDETRQARLSSSDVQSKHGSTFKEDLPETEELSSIPSENREDMPAPKKSTNSTNLHPSVLFILGADETDSDDDDDQDDFDDFTSDISHDVPWDPFQTFVDPFNPLQGWKCTIKKTTPTIPLTVTCTSMKSSSGQLDSLDESTVSVQTRRRSSAITPPCNVVSEPSLKHAASTGCLRNLSGKRRQGGSNIIKKVITDGVPSLALGKENVSNEIKIF